VRRLVIIFAMIATSILGGTVHAQDDYFLGLYRNDRFPDYASSLVPAQQDGAFETWLVDLGGAGWVQTEIKTALAPVIDRYRAHSLTRASYSFPFAGLYFLCQAESPSSAICGAFFHSGGYPSQCRYYSFFRLFRGQGASGLRFIKSKGQLRGLNRFGVAFSVVAGQARCMVYAGEDSRWDGVFLTVIDLGGGSECNRSGAVGRNSWGEDIRMVTHPVEDGTEVYALLVAKGADDYQTLRLYRVTDKTESVPFTRDEESQAQSKEVVRVSPQSIAPLASAKLIQMYGDLLKAPGAREHKIEYPTPKMGTALKEYYDSLKSGGE